MVPFSLTKPLISCWWNSFVFFFFFLVTQTSSCEWSRKDHFFLYYYYFSTKPKLYSNSFPMPSQTHKPLSLNTLTLISQIFQSMIQRGLVCFRDQKLSGKKRMVRTQRMEKSKYVRNWSHNEWRNDKGRTALLFYLHQRNMNINYSVQNSKESQY